MLLALAYAVSLIPAPAGTPQKAIAALALTAFTVALWAFNTIPQPAASVLFAVLVVLTGTASPGAAFSGYMSSALGLVFGGLLIGTAAERTGLGRYIARRFLGSFGVSYSSLVLGILIGTFILSFLVPSNVGRIAISVPIVIALAAEVGYAPGSRGYVGLVCTAVIGNFTVALAIMPANLLNIMVIGTAEAVYGVTISYMRYLVMCLPVLGILKGLLVWRMVPLLFPAPAPKPPEAARTDVLGREAIRVGIILGLAILAWATDFLHGIKPGIVALAAGFACAVPGLGPLRAADLADSRRLGVVVWVGGVLTIGGVLLESGASTLVASILGQLTAGVGRSPLLVHLAIAYVLSALTVPLTVGGAIPIVTSAVATMIAPAGIPLETGILSMTAGLSALFFPYISAPLVVGIRLGKVSERDAIRFTVWTSLATWALIIPLNALWWKVLGALP